MNAKKRMLAKETKSVNGKCGLRLHNRGTALDKFCTLGREARRVLFRLTM